MLFNNRLNEIREELYYLYRIPEYTREQCYKETIKKLEQEFLELIKLQEVDER